MFALGIRYLTGYAVATDVSNREKAEWPPHPARAFMAMAAAYFETGEDEAERVALEWLESLPPPAMRVSDAEARDAVTHYVPVNDPSVPTKTKGDVKKDAVKHGVSVLPQHRSRQPRFFPRVRPGEDTLHLIWPGKTADAACLGALKRLCAKVIRIGHSSSFVQMWVEGNPPAANWNPDEDGSVQLRVGTEGTLDYLKSQFNATVSRRPTIGLWQSYCKVEEAKGQEEAISGAFDREMMILTLQKGPTIGLETTWQLLTALRDTILARCDPTPEWVSGHRGDGSPSEEPHVALLPLAFVGDAHADGHLLGVGLAFPKKMGRRERGRALRRLLYDDSGEPSPIDLKLGILGAWTLARETRESDRRALQNETWTKPSRIWATVTPIVLDRHPKADYVKERSRWLEECRDIIAESCRRQGLPTPATVEVGKTSWHTGAPRAIPGKGGFALMPTKASQPMRQQVHARLIFDRKIEGPLALGAGRYRGYGFCKPLSGGGQ